MFFEKNFKNEHADSSKIRVETQIDVLSGKSAMIGLSGLGDASIDSDYGRIDYAIFTYSG